MTVSVGMPMFTRNVVSVNRPTCERWRPDEKAWYNACMQGGKAVCVTAFGKPSISVLPIFSIDSFLILSAVSKTFCGNLGKSLTSVRFSTYLRISSARSLDVSFPVRWTFPFVKVRLTSFHFFYRRWVVFLR